MAAAAPVAKQRERDARHLLGPLSVLKHGDLDFGMLAVTGAGTAVIDPSSGALTTTGGVVPAADRPSCRDLHRDRNQEQRHQYSPSEEPDHGDPRRRHGDNDGLQLDARRQYQPQGATRSQTLDFAVGATLNVGANQAQGTYVGTFDVTVQYP